MALGPSLVLAEVAGSRVLSSDAFTPPQLFAPPALLAADAAVGRDFSRASAGVHPGVARPIINFATLDRYLHADYFSTNQTGNQRDKQKMLQLFKSFPIQSLSTKVLRVNVNGDIGVVTGTMDERSGTGNDHILFTHTYAKSRGGWQLLSAHQSVYDEGAPYDGTRGRSTREMFTQLAGGGRVGTGSPATRATTSAGFTVEEVRVGGSCIIVVSGTQQLAVTGCTPR